ncbi:MAG TPA: hypothetical protein VME68_08075 [Acidobacteriaceae bacterium]|nr:hypothetical protein [Acidobacteriaceae bacterium]
MTFTDARALTGKRVTTRAMIARALCEIAEEEMQAGQQERAWETIRSVRTIAADIEIQVCGDVSALPLGDLREATELLLCVDERLADIESLLRPGTPAIGGPSKHNPHSPRTGGLWQAARIH